MTRDDNDGQRRYVRAAGDPDTEGYMTRLFPGAYPEYQQSTKMLIPSIF